MKINLSPATLFITRLPSGSGILEERIERHGDPLDTLQVDLLHVFADGRHESGGSLERARESNGHYSTLVGDFIHTIIILCYDKK